MSRVTEYTSLDELRHEATSIVIAEPVSSESLGLGTETAPLSFQVDTMRVSEVIEGRKTQEIQVFAEGPDKFPTGRTFLLFLRPQFANGDVMAVVGYQAGIYEAVEQDPELGDLFGRVDPESPKLPLGIAVKDGTLQPVG